jgi:phenylacetate-coenzyme A ligase PaaK-like adenylate-forming protein
MDLYRRLPGPFQTLAAGIRGYQLQRRRYGKQTEALVGEALERDSWDAERWKQFREERLAFVLHHAATRVPYYREQWARRRREGDRASWEILANWPILSKNAVRETPRAFLAEGADRQYETSTSGTTATPLRLFQSRETLVSWYAIFEARIRRWHGVSVRDRWAHLGGQRVIPGPRTKPPYWVWNPGMNQLYMSTYHIRLDAVDAYLEALRRYRIRYLFGYASALYALAGAVRERGLQAPQMAVVFSNAEAFYPFQREVIAEVFRCPVRDTWGQAEIVSGGSECPSGTMHFWPEVGQTEWLRDDADEPVGVAEPGRMISTGFLNAGMPLVRYEGGDRSTPAAPGVSCACGRGLPIIRSLDGRQADIILTPDGVPVGGLDLIFHPGIPMREGQIIQESLLRFRVKVVPAPGFASRHSEEMSRGLRNILGDRVEVVVETVESIPRTAAGKFVIQVSLLKDRGRIAAYPEQSREFARSDG